MIFTSEQQANAQNYVSSLKQLKDYITDFNGAVRISNAKEILSIDTKELNDAVSIFEKLKTTQGDTFEAGKAKSEAMSQAFQNASQAARDFASTNELNSESVGKFVQGQQQAIDVMQKTSLASKAAAAGMGLLNAAMTGLAVAVASWAIGELIQKFDEYIHRQELAAEKTQQLQSEFESLQEEIASNKNELSQITQRLAELQSFGTLSFTEKDEYNNLVEQREELERILAIQDKLAEYKNQGASNQAVKYFNTKTTYFDPTMESGYRQNYGTILDEANMQLDYIDSLNQKLKEQKEELYKVAEAKGVDSSAYKSLVKDIQQTENELGKWKTKSGETIESINEQAKSLDKKSASTAEYRKQIEDLNNRLISSDAEKFSNITSKDEFKDLNDQLLRLATAGNLDENTIRSHQEFTRVIENEGLSVSDVVNEYYQLAEAQKSASNPNVDLSTMDGLKTRLEEILDKAGAISAMDLNPASLSEGTDTQKEAWAELSRLMSDTGMSLEEMTEKAIEFGLVSNDAADLMTDAFIEANQNSATFNKNLSDVTNRTDTLIAAYKELDKGNRLSSNTIQNLIEAYPQLETELIEYLAGLRSQTQIMADLEEMYQLDSENWKALMVAKMAYNEDFFKNIVLANEGWVSAFAQKYDIDLSNCKTYAQAKKKIMDALASDMERIGGRITEVEDSTGAIITHSIGASVEETTQDTGLLEQALKDLENISFSGVEAQFDSLSSAIDNTKNAAEEAKQAFQSIASTSLSAISGLVDVTMSMLKQGLQNQKDQIEQDLDDLKNKYDATKDQLEADKKAALASLDAQKKALQAQKKAQDAAYDREIDRLKDLKDAQNDIYDDRIQAAEDELDAYNKIIDAQLKLLRLKEEQHDYERELADKQKDIADLEAQLAELGLDDSIEAQKKRLELEEELAAKREELEEFQHDKNVSDQEQALEDEKEAFNDKQQAIIDGIQAEKDAYNEMIDAKIEAIRREKEAFDENISAQIDAIELQKEQTQAYYDAQLASLERNYESDRALREKRKEEIDKQIQDEAALRQQAIALIQGKSDEFYQRLIEWNRKYGTGIDADIIVKWNNAYTALETFGGKQFDVLQVMNQLTTATNTFRDYLDEAVEKAGDLASALQTVLDQQSKVLDMPPSYASGGSSNGAIHGRPGAQFHEGGEVGKDNNLSANNFNKFMDNLKSDEIPAILKLKEWVLTEEQQGDIMQLASAQKETIMAFSRLMGDLSTAMTSNSIPSLNNIMSQTTIPSLPDLATASGGDQPISIQINTEITGNADDNVMDKWFAKNTAAFQDRVARYTLDQINYKRGLRTYR